MNSDCTVTKRDQKKANASCDTGKHHDRKAELRGEHYGSEKAKLHQAPPTFKDDKSDSQFEADDFSKGRTYNFNKGTKRPRETDHAQGNNTISHCSRTSTDEIDEELSVLMKKLKLDDDDDETGSVNALPGGTPSGWRKGILPGRLSGAPSELTKDPQGCEGQCGVLPRGGMADISLLATDNDGSNRPKVLYNKNSGEGLPGDRISVPAEVPRPARGTIPLSRAEWPDRIGGGNECYKTDEDIANYSSSGRATVDNEISDEKDELHSYEKDKKEKYTAERVSCVSEETLKKTESAPTPKAKPNPANCCNTRKEGHSELKSDYDKPKTVTRSKKETKESANNNRTDNRTQDGAKSGNDTNVRDDDLINCDVTSRDGPEQGKSSTLPLSDNASYDSRARESIDKNRNSNGSSIKRETISSKMNRAEITGKNTSKAISRDNFKTTDKSASSDDNSLNRTNSEENLIGNNSTNSRSSSRSSSRSNSRSSSRSSSRSNSRSSNRSNSRSSSRSSRRSSRSRNRSSGSSKSSNSGRSSSSDSCTHSSSGSSKSSNSGSCSGGSKRIICSNNGSRCSSTDGSSHTSTNSRSKRSSNSVDMSRNSSLCQTSSKTTRSPKSSTSSRITNQNTSEDETNKMSNRDENKGRRNSEDKHEKEVQKQYVDRSTSYSADTSTKNFTFQKSREGIKGQTYNGDSERSSASEIVRIQYKWQYQDGDGWTTYGQVPSNMNLSGANTVTSDDIELYYLIDEEKCPLLIEVNNVQYKLDFQKMTETNQKTLSRRNIRRTMKSSMDDYSACGQTDRPPNSSVDNHLAFGSRDATDIPSYVNTGITASNKASIDRTNNYDRYHSNSIQTNGASAKFQWQFQDEFGKWITYGTSNSSGTKQNATSSDDIEQVYRKDPHRATFRIQSNLHQHILNFHTMTQTNEVTHVQRKVQRIQMKSVETSLVSTVKGFFGNLLGSGKGTSIQFEWQFQDEHGMWITYGQTNSAGMSYCATTETSDDIEKYFTSLPKKVMMTTNSRTNKYVLDFTAMTQINEKTSVQRPIRRVPKIRKGNGTPINVGPRAGCSGHLDPLQLNSVRGDQYFSSNRSGVGAHGNHDRGVSFIPPVHTNHFHNSNHGISHKWQFMDESGTWITYGQNSLAGNYRGRTTTSSDEIEMFFCNNNLQQPMLVYNSLGVPYLLDLKNGIQLNTVTGTQKFIRRVSR